MFSKNIQQTSAPYCLWCYGVEKLSRCSRCGNAHYCCRDHQVQHWKIHRKNCKPALKTNLSSDNNVLSTTHSLTRIPDDIVNLATENLSPQLTQDIQQSMYSTWLTNNVEETSASTSSPDVPFSTPEPVTPTQTLYATGECIYPSDIEQAAAALFVENDAPNLDNFYAASSDLEEKLLTDNNIDVFSSISSELLSSTNNYWDLINSCNSENFGIQYDLDINNFPKSTNERVIESSADEVNFVSLPPPSVPTVIDVTDTEDNNNCPEKILLIEDVCQNVVHDLNEFGICVIDNFLGTKMGDLIAAEVKSMFLKGIFKKGELVSSNTWHPNQNVRGDVITWVNGSETGCHYIGNLIRKLDFIMAACNKMPDNGILSDYKLNRRTKAMIACYPGDGTHYKKHIDNPNNDGRCITCIYYLNKKWDIKTYGGLLRMFPMGHENEVANIEPIFDRMLFFWSDKRNPHEVLPSYAVRFAITVWYFDSDERDKALQRGRAQQQQHK